MPEPTSLEQLERRVKADPTSIAFAALAEEYRRAGRYQEAIAVCRAGLERHPAYLSARVTLGRALIEVGELDEAKAELERVLAVAPENLAAIRGLAEIHHRRGEIPEATEHYRSALEITEQRAIKHPEPASAGRPLREAGDEEPHRPSFEGLAESLPSGPVLATVGPVPRPTARTEGPPPPSSPALAALERFLEAIQALRHARQRSLGA